MMGKKTLLMIILTIGLFVIACGQQNTEITKTCNPPYFEYQTGQCCLDSNNNSICDIDEQQVQTVDTNAEVEQFAEKLVYYMNNAECDKLYLYLAEEYKNKTNEDNFTGICNYWIYELSFKLDKVTEIEDGIYTAYINLVNKDYFETIKITTNDDGSLDYIYFEEFIGYTNLRDFCNARKKLSEEFDYCVQRYGKANRDESACDFMGADYKVASCKSVVKASIGE